MQYLLDTVKHIAEKVEIIADDLTDMRVDSAERSAEIKAIHLKINALEKRPKPEEKSQLKTVFLNGAMLCGILLVISTLQRLTNVNLLDLFKMH